MRRATSARRADATPMQRANARPRPVAGRGICLQRKDEASEVSADHQTARAMQ